MSKPKTLLDFFSKSPRNNSPAGSVSKTPKTGSPCQNKGDNTSKNKVSNSTPKSYSNSNGKFQKRTIESDDGRKSEEENELEIKSSTKVKRRRIIIPSDDDDSEDEYKPTKDASSSEESMLSDVSETESPVKKRKTTKTVSTPALASFLSPKSGSAKKSIVNGTSTKTKNAVKLSPISSKNTSLSKEKNVNDSLNESIDENNENVLAKEWMHENLDWLKDDKIKDKYGKRKSDPDYNLQTLYVPESFKKNLTPAMKQWWDMKSDHFDSVLFFKVGKFYELYHMDAVVGVKELKLTFMKGEFAHSGFPEIAFGRFSECLVKKGYKVARVEQTENPQMMEERCKNMHRPTKFDKVVKREICQITTKGTRTLTYQEEPMGADNNFLLAICEKHFENSESESEYGVCFVDTTIGKFSLGQFKDDRHGSRLMTLIAIYPPVEIIYERSSVSKSTLQLLSNNSNSFSQEAFGSNSEFWDSKKVLKYLSEQKFFDDGSSEKFPEVLKNMLDPDDRLEQTPLKQYELAYKSLCACVWYLKECLIDDSLVTMKLFEEYVPADGYKRKHSKAKSFINQHMVLDGVTLRNLEIVNSQSSDTDGSLFTTMDFCFTKFGKRLFRYWLCSPLCNPKSISDRLDAIEDLMNTPDAVENAIIGLKKVPDLERLLSKIHSQGLSRSKNHPETRAIFYEADIYNKRKLNDFLSTLDGFRETIEIISHFQSHAKDFKSSLLIRCVTTIEENGSFPDLSDALDFLSKAFDVKEAKKEGNIIPTEGVDPDYDSACAQMKEVEEELSNYLEEIKRNLNCKVSYVGSGRTRFQIEVPDTKKVPKNFEFQGARKGFRRFYTDETRDFLVRYTAAEESRDAALRDASRRIFAQFDKDYEMWKSAVQCIATLDVLISLLLYNKSSTVSLCRPEFILPDDSIEPFLEIVEGKHPSFLKYFTDDSYIPNSVYIGPKKEKKEDINGGGRVVLVTGPNMGGKSTLMRQAGALVIMAQIGSFVPASSMKLTPVDRIFTRVGANDHISKGESTFFVEGSETSIILHHATRDSFVLVDELGRGTSTHDGTAIAYSVLDNLANEICCRTLFSTHYHSLIEDFQGHPTVGLGHMACMVEKDSDCPALERITFLYKFIGGACPKSYGFNVAMLAGISKDVIQKGFRKAQEMECVPKISELLKKFLRTKTPSEIIQDIQKNIAAMNIECVTQS